MNFSFNSCEIWQQRISLDVLSLAESRKDTLFFGGAKPKVGINTGMWILFIVNK